eukprot:GHVQ01007192.1.p1 GENE.GHVQ01007192.1~~GHVQ01007192.1.p1  ORF type:complete len:255 (+),score=43.63 GHVQ01007192.1:90-854(+)
MATVPSPSNPSPFSPELQTFIVTKYDPLLSIIRELNERLQASEKERFRLERRIQRVEHFVLTAQKGGGEEARKDTETIEDIEGTSAVAPLLESEEALVAPWLFSCQTGTPTSALQVLLEFTPDTTEELDVQLWKREEDLWLKFLDELPDEFANRTPDSLQLVDIRRAARRALLELCRGEIMFILRNVPGKSEAPNNPTGITLTAIFAAALSEAWARVEASNPQGLGRVGLVLEGHQIGSRLRAGRKRFRIEQLN